MRGLARRNLDTVLAAILESKIEDGPEEPDPRWIEAMEESCPRPPEIRAAASSTRTGTFWSFSPRLLPSASFPC